ncbi:hypothetical protein DMENIID0001_038440 [Sergentomyia squamirostris]
MAKIILLVVLSVLCCVTLSECRSTVIYSKRKKTVPSRNKNVKNVEEVYETFHTHIRPPVYGHSETFINNFLAHDYDYKTFWSKQRTTTVAAVAPEVIVSVTAPPMTTRLPEKLVSLSTIKPNPYENVNPNGNLLPWQPPPPSTTQAAVHPDVEVEFHNELDEWTGTTENPWWPTEEVITESTTSSTPPSTTTTTEATTTETEEPEELEDNNRDYNYGTEEKDYDENGEEEEEDEDEGTEFDADDDDYQDEQEEDEPKNSTTTTTTTTTQRSFSWWR